MAAGKVLQSHIEEMQGVMKDSIKPLLESSHEEVKKAVADLKAQGFTFGSAETTEQFINAVAELESAVEELGELSSLVDQFNQKIAGVLSEEAAKARQSTEAVSAATADAKAKANS